MPNAPYPLGPRKRTRARRASAALLLSASRACEAGVRYADVPHDAALAFAAQ